VIFCTNHPSTKTLYQLDVIRYNAIIASIAKGDIGLVDIEWAILDSTEEITNMVMPDGVHLSEAGHSFYFNTLKPVLDKEIEVLVG
jgi:lysophospholipase L1-like esterase